MLTYLAQITNPGIGGGFGEGGAGGSLVNTANLIATLWSVFLTLAGLAMILFIISGAFAWITSNGDKAKVEGARNRIVAAITGLAILFSMFALVNFIFPAIGLNILNPEIQDNLQDYDDGGAILDPDGSDEAQ